MRCNYNLMSDYKKDLATFYKWLKQAKEAIFLIASTLAIIYSDEIKSFISSVGNEISVNPLTLVFLILAIIAAILLIRRVIKVLQARKHKLIESDKKHVEHGGVQFYACRDELPKLGDFLLEAKQEIWFMGVSLEKVVGQTAEAFKKKIREGVSIKFLFLDPESSLIKSWDNAMITATKKAIEGSIERLCDLKSRLPEDERQKLEIILYDLIPFNTFILLDPKTENAKALIELYLYKTEPDQRPSILVTKEEQPDLFKTYWESCQFALKKENCRKHECPTSEPKKPTSSSVPYIER